MKTITVNTQNIALTILTTAMFGFLGTAIYFIREFSLEYPNPTNPNSGMYSMIALMITFALLGIMGHIIQPKHARGYSPIVLTVLCLALAALLIGVLII